MAKSTRGSPYEINAIEFVRFRVDANDDFVAGIVRAVTARGVARCAEFRLGLVATEADTLSPLYDAERSRDDDRPR